MFVIGVAGGTCSGKSTIAEKLQERLGDTCRIIHMDSYFRRPFGYTVAPITGKTYVEHNHPDALELDRLYADVDEAMTDGKLSVVIVEGLFALQLDELRERLDFKVFVDLDSDERLVRRIRRFTAMGQTFDEVTDRYIDTVRFRHNEIIESSRWHADIVVNGNADDVPVDVLVTYIRSKLG